MIIIFYKIVNIVKYSKIQFRAHLNIFVFIVIIILNYDPFIRPMFFKNFFFFFSIFAFYNHYIPMLLRLVLFWAF